MPQHVLISTKFIEPQDLWVTGTYKFVNVIFVKMNLSPFHKLILWLGFALPVAGIGQGRLIDSLHRVVNTAKDDTNKVNAMNALSEH